MSTSKMLRSTTITASLIFLLTGCVVAADSPQPEPTENEGPTDPNAQSTDADNPNGREVIASTVGSSTEIGEGLQLDVYALETVGGNLLRLRAGITNNSSESFPIYDSFSDFDEPLNASRITLIDPVNQNRHLSFSQSDGNCFCQPHDSTIGSGESVDTWVVFPAPPDGVESMIITTPVTPPILDVPITSSTETLENPGLSDPEILDITNITDNLEDQTGRTENEDEVSIILSSDVLFETNSANLSSDAQEILEQVSAEISDASGDVIRIDGHADNTGNDSVNLPLSEERAEAVESTIQELVTRSGVSFEVEGHGSSEPIADNNTEEGRERNRRVSVTFEK